ncbi:MAG: hypothetical protein GY805_20180 [Chloroflexi bacterium]|nr:hypothetical protein [Chloroflexota bacterium]
MDKHLHYSKQASQPIVMQTKGISLRNLTARQLQKEKERACMTLQQHTEALRQLMAEMRSFDHKTSVEAVVEAQCRSEALRWLNKAIEREVQRLDKGYREAAQREQFLRDQALLTAV